MYFLGKPINYIFILKALTIVVMLVLESSMVGSEVGMFFSVH